ncbi:MAG: ParA family protein [Bacteroidetes bacterium]|nr:MAG: ParA family protein [Bacteroidota bacterium]
MILFALYNSKGGVGKTTSAVNLAYLASRDGFKTLLWDLDPQGASTFYLNMTASDNGHLKNWLEDPTHFEGQIQTTAFPNLWHIPANIKNRNADIDLKSAEKTRQAFKVFKGILKEKFDYVFVDCPPTMSQLAHHIFRAAHYILIPVIPTTLSVRTFEQIVDYFDKKELDIRKLIPFFTLVDQRKQMHRQTMERFREAFPKVLRSTIPTASEIEKMGLQQAPVYTFSPDSRGSLAYRNLWQELKWFKKLKTPVR